jgi:hypothetical protein
MTAKFTEPAETLKREADRIADLILNSDLPWVDIAIQIENMRELCRDIDPDSLELFERIYDSRFQRLREQWRGECNPDFWF